jgi:hypothetical protein
MRESLGSLEDLEDLEDKMDKKTPYHGFPKDWATEGLG